MSSESEQEFSAISQERTASQTKRRLSAAGSSHGEALRYWTQNRTLLFPAPSAARGPAFECSCLTSFDFITKS